MQTRLCQEQFKYSRIESASALLVRELQKKLKYTKTTRNKREANRGQHLEASIITLTNIPQHFEALNITSYIFDLLSLRLEETESGGGSAIQSS
jgi:hypothetical protein